MKTQTKTTTIRQRRRTAILDAAARRLTNISSATWRNLETIFTNALFPEPITENDLDNRQVSKKLTEITTTMHKNASRAEGGTAVDLVEIVQTMPRLPSTRKTKKKK